MAQFLVREAVVAAGAGAAVVVAVATRVEPAAVQDSVVHVLHNHQPLGGPQRVVVELA